MTRVVLLRVSVVLLASSVAYGRADDLPYTQVSRVPRVVDGSVLFDFEFDPISRRVYACSEEGVYWVDVRAREPRVNGPILPREPHAIAIAANLGRLYFSRDREHFGYVNLRTNETKITTPRDSSTFAYDPEKRILVVPTIEVPDHPRVRLHAYAFNAAGFRPLGELPNPANDGSRVYPMHGGFIQEGHDSLLFWLAR